ncbi:TetR/AcrR family transcriptional regulator [Microbispora sp. GKU 823]|uniref:TetR/AcrR family transcriptional regulator n=1 Tax=Microbispora sp. GKU 823 TaxID=1652100 RepID=UPI0021190927|nr:helix-turn-helix domain-containing protein [Microbispora sp. GKU 823]
MRADARRNRALIVDAAVDLFTARGPEASMEEIAQAAGLGVGTLYRHFPDRRALLEEIAAGALRTLLDAARDHAARPVSRWDALLACVRCGADLPLALTKSLSDASRPIRSWARSYATSTPRSKTWPREPSGRATSATTSHRARSSGC